MTISQLVEALQALQIRHGDVPVYLKVYTARIAGDLPGAREINVDFDQLNKHLRVSALQGFDDEH